MFYELDVVAFYAAQQEYPIFLRHLSNNNNVTGKKVQFHTTYYKLGRFLATITQTTIKFNPNELLYIPYMLIKKYLHLYIREY